jgi:hypothetical protein
VRGGVSRNIRRGERVARRQVSRRAMSSFVKSCQVLSSFVKGSLDATSSDFKGLRPKHLTSPPSRRVLAAWTALASERRASRRTKGKDNPDSAIREEIVGPGMTRHDEDTMRIPDRRPAALRAARRLTANSSAATGGASSAGSAVDFMEASCFRSFAAVNGARVARRKTGVSRRPVRAPPPAVEDQ